MPTSLDVVRGRRRQRAQRRSRNWIGRLGSALAALISLLVGAAGLVGALMFAGLTENLPSVQTIEAQFDASSGLYRTTAFYDRTGQTRLLEVLTPAAADRRAVRLATELPDHAPQHLLQASIALQDPQFWTSPGYDPAWLAQVLLATLRRQPVPQGTSIAQQLARNTLLPPGEQHRSPVAQALREALLASELTRTYSREQILEWYLNSAYYGQLANGMDAAALVYFGKHASELSLAESALLAAIPLDPSLNPVDAPQQAKAQQALVLEAMVREGYLDAAVAEAATAESLTFGPPPPLENVRAASFSQMALGQLAELLGPGFAHRGGLRVTTTLDYDVQLQAECVSRTQLARLSGADPGEAVPAADGSACIAAGLLAPLRPSDAGVDHAISGAAVVVIDPTTGEILAVVSTGGMAEEPGARELNLAVDGVHQPGSTLFPFIYLTAFSTGYTPASMVLDVPTTFTDPVTGQAYNPANRDDLFHGPIRMRAALAGSYNLPAMRTLGQLGVEDVLHTARQMGLTTLGPDVSAYGPRLARQGGQVSLLDLTYAYSVLANRGTMAGVPIAPQEQTTGMRGLGPAAILRIEDATGEVVYEYVPGGRAVVSPQLAYLMDDVLSDETARWPAFGHPNVLEVGRPAAVQTGTTENGADNWTVGFTPSLAVGVWVGNADGEPMRGIGALNGAAPIWNAITRYATRDLPSEGWEMPAGVSLVEVCDPSGLLPTAYCPNVVRETFVQGTEPSYYDTLYQPFRVNRETGKLATLFTPLDFVEERVYLIPPPEAAQWARQAGIEQPPQEYDTVYEQAYDPEVNIASPSPFEVLRGQVEVRGDARPDGFDYYRLQYGQGLNPTHWVQIGNDLDAPVEAGRLGRWDTAGLSGLYVLQLMVVQEGGRVETAAVPVTIDNQPPSIRLVSPAGGESFTWPVEPGVILQVEVSDDLSLARVEFYVDGRGVATATAPPYSTRWRLGTIGEHVVFATAWDSAGNRAESERVTISITR
jgi:membrane peptidoglycan carboxypeptidase